MVQDTQYGDGVITFTDASSQLGGVSSITITVVSLQLVILFMLKMVFIEKHYQLEFMDVAVQGESLRGTEIRLNGGQGHQVKTVTTSSTLAGVTEGTYSYKQFYNKWKWNRIYSKCCNTVQMEHFHQYQYITVVQVM